MKVKSSSGSIHIEGAQQNNVTYTIREHVHAGSEDRARRELSHMKFTTFSSGETVVLQADCEGSNQGSIDFDIKVPAQTQLVRLQTEGGAVAAKNLSGRVEAKTGGGGIQLDGITGVIAVSSGGGNIDIGKVGNDVEASTGGGSIRLVSAAGHVTAKIGRRESEHRLGQGDDAANGRRVDPSHKVRWQDQSRNRWRQHRAE